MLVTKDRRTIETRSSSSSARSPGVDRAEISSNEPQGHLRDGEKERNTGGNPAEKFPRKIGRRTAEPDNLPSSVRAVRRQRPRRRESRTARGNRITPPSLPPSSLSLRRHGARFTARFVPDPLIRFMGARYLSRRFKAAF